MNLAFLKAVTVIMGIMIIAGIIVLGFTVANRLSGAGAGREAVDPIALSPPSDSRLVGAAASPDGLVLTFERARRDGGTETLIAIHEIETGRRIGFFLLPALDPAARETRP